MASLCRESRQSLRSGCWLTPCKFTYHRVKCSKLFVPKEWLKGEFRLEWLGRSQLAELKFSMCEKRDNIQNGITFSLIGININEYN